MPAMIISTFISFLMNTFVTPGMTPISEAITQRAFTQWPYRPMSIDQAIQLYRRGVIGKNGFEDMCTRNGINNKIAHNLMKGSVSLIDAQKLVIIKWREKLGDKDYYDHADKLGFDKDEIDCVENSMKYYPNPQDFIRFAVRDTFDSAVVKKYGYDKNYPVAIDKQVRKAGIDPEWMKHFWRAHWQLPSVNQGYEMMHRGEIDENGLSELLRVSDIPDYWRERLINISYSPFTRVDLRRMRKTGILDYDQVLQGYKDIGYDDIKAKQLADYAEEYTIEEPKNIAETKVKDAYFTNKINVNEAIGMLNDLGFDQKSADFIIALWNDDLQEIELQNTIDNIKAEFLYGGMNETELTDAISKLALPATGIEKIVMDIINAKLRMKQLPTKSDVIRWYNAKIINEDKFKQILTQLGYSEKYVENYLLETKIGGSAEFRVPTKADYLNFLKKDIISIDEWINGMFALGYSDNDIENYAELYELIPPKKLAETKVKKSWLRENIDDVEAKRLLRNLGYDDEGIDFIFELWIEDKRILDLKAQST